MCAVELSMRIAGTSISLMFRVNKNWGNIFLDEAHCHVVCLFVCLSVCCRGQMESGGGPG